MTDPFPPPQLRRQALPGQSGVRAAQLDLAEPTDPGLLSHALEVAGRLANDAAEVMAATADRGGRRGNGGAAHPAHPFDWVTDTERTLERHTRRVLTAAFPDIPLVDGLHEPRGARESRYRWVVSPIDGGTNFVAGLPWYAFGLALLDERGPVVGVLSDPSRAEIYAAARGRGMRANGMPVRLAGTGEPAPYPPVPGLPVCTELAGQDGWPGLSTFLGQVAGAGREVRVLGSAGLAITQVALGHAVATVLPRCREREVAPGLALALEAGAAVLDERGRPTVRPTDGLLVVAPSAVTELVDWWSAARGTTSQPAG